MKEVTATVEIDRPADEVFSYLSDFENNPRWQRGMRSARWTSDPPHRAGSTYDQVAVFLGKQVVSSFRVERLVPGRSVTIASSSGAFPITVTREVEALGADRCRVTARVAGDPAGFYRLAGPLLRLVVARSVQGDYRRLKELLETERV